MAAFAIIPAAGSGQRLGSSVPKALVVLAGKTLVRRSVEAFVRCGRFQKIVVTYPAGFELEFQGALAGIAEVVLVPGGATRTASVRAGIEALIGPGEEQAVNAGADDVVLVHDAARCLIEPEFIIQVLRSTEQFGAAVLAVPVVDTVVRAEGAAGHNYGPVVDRTDLWAIQTPQGFRFSLLQKAHATVVVSATDDASLVRDLHEVKLVVGDRKNLKITTREDLALAEGMIGK